MIMRMENEGEEVNAQSSRGVNDEISGSVR